MSGIGGHRDQAPLGAGPRLVRTKTAAGGANSSNGKPWATAKADIQAGIDAAYADAGQCNAWVAQGTYLPNYEANPLGAANTATILAHQGIAVYGGFAGTEYSLAARNVSGNVTTISGEIGTSTSTDNISTLVTATSGGQFDGFTISGGYATPEAARNWHRMSST